MNVHVHVCMNHSTILLLLFSKLSDGYVDVILYRAAFGEGSGPIHMNYLGCYGSEYKLVDCDYRTSTYQHNEDWSVICKNGNHYVHVYTHQIVYACTFPSFQSSYI